MPHTQLEPDETDLRGQWIERGGAVVGDEICRRIKALIATGALEQVAGGVWETLYRDRVDGRLWERTYPQSELHGGGPPRLTLLDLDSARAKYGWPAA